MGKRKFQEFLPDECHRRYCCVHCRAHLANHDELISKVCVYTCTLCLGLYVFSRQTSPVLYPSSNCTAVISRQSRKGIPLQQSVSQRVVVIIGCVSFVSILVWISAVEERRRGSCWLACMLWPIFFAAHVKLHLAGNMWVHPQCIISCRKIVGHFHTMLKVTLVGS